MRSRTQSPDLIVLWSILAALGVCLLIVGWFRWATP
jgi:hypothetical protein